MKKRKVLFLFVLSMLIFAGLSFYFPKLLNTLVNKRLRLVEVVCAAHDIEPRTIIEETDLQTVTIPAAYLQDKVYISKEDVIGKVSVKEGFIPEGSLFYYSAVEEKMSKSDHVLFDLKDDQVLFTLQTDIVALGANAIVPGQVVDVYASLENDQHETVTGPLIEKVRIVGVKDHKGLDLNHLDSSGMPHVIQLALSKEAVPVLQKAVLEGNISYYVTAAAYRISDECNIIWDSELIELLNLEKEKAIEG